MALAMRGGNSPATSAPPLSYTVGAIGEKWRFSMKRCPIRITIVASAACLATLVVIPAVFPHDYHPLQIGSHWQYFSTYWGDESMTIVGDQLILGVTTRVRLQSEPDQVWENFWSKDSSGDLFLHGAVNFTDPFAVAYSPPIKMVAAPLYLGKTWVTTGIRPCDFDGTPWEGDPFDYPLRVYSEGALTVPAGAFYSYGVGYDVGTGLLLTTHQGTFDIFGRHLGNAQLTADNAAEWYSDGIGVVQSCVFLDRQYASRLVAYQLPSVATEATTWGRVKTNFWESDGIPQTNTIRP
jgi:hypothetical protein